MKKLKRFLLTHTPSVYWKADGYLYEEEPKFYNGDQVAWNQTLITKINQCSAMICKESLTGGANAIIIGPDMYDILKTYEYFKRVNTANYRGYHKIGELSGRYHVYLIPKLEIRNKVFVCKQVDVEHTLTDVSNYSHVAVVRIDKFYGY